MANVDFSELLGSLADMDAIFSQVPVQASRTVTTTQGQQHQAVAFAAAAQGTYNPAPYAQAAWQPTVISQPSTLKQQQPPPSSAITSSDFFMPQPAPMSETAAPIYQNGSISKRPRGRTGGAKEQISDLEQELRRKLAELRVLESQNLRLRSKSRMLEVTVCARDEQVVRLKGLRAGMQALQASEQQQRMHPAISSSSAPGGQALTIRPEPASTLIPISCFELMGCNSAPGIEDLMLEPLQPLDAHALQSYNQMSIEQLMSLYHDVIGKLTSELCKPGLGSLNMLMANLREFTRAMALCSDKLQLMASRDVSSVPRASLVASTSEQFKQLGGGGGGLGMGLSLVHAQSVSSASSGRAPPLPLPSPSHASTEYPRSADSIGQERASDTASTPGPTAAPSAAELMMVMAPQSELPGVRSAPTSIDSLAISPQVTHTGLPMTPGAEPVQQHWYTVALSLNLSPQQLEDLLALHELSTGWLGRVSAERTEITTQMQQLNAQLLHRLHRNVQLEHAVLMLFGEVFMYKVLTLEQAARVLVGSWPRIPDPAAIVTALALAHAPGRV